MDYRAFDRITTMSDREFDRISAMDEGEYREYERNRVAQRRINERLNHRFSDDIGGSSSNYRSPYFGRG